MIAPRFLMVSFVIPAFLWASSASGEAFSEQIERGNALYRKGAYDAALKAYEKAQGQYPDSPHLAFNKGNAYFQKGDFERARDAYEKAALTADASSLKAKAHYNLGNTAFHRGQRLSPTDMEEALSLYDASVRHYREALRTDPDMPEAAHNIEVARLRMKELWERIQKQKEESREGQEQREEAAKQLRQAVEDQKGALDSNRLAGRKKEGGSGEPSPEELEKIAARQQEAGESTRKASEEMDGYSVGDSSDDAGQIRKKLDEAMARQSEALKAIQNERLKEAREHQEVSLKALKQVLADLASESASRKASRETGESGEEQLRTARKSEAQPGEKQEPQAALPQKSAEGADSWSAEEEAQDILREERENRLKRQRMRHGRYNSVEKDW